MPDYKDFELDIRSSGTAEADRAVTVSINNCIPDSNAVCGLEGISDTCSICHSYCGSHC